MKKVLLFLILLSSVSLAANSTNFITNTEIQSGGNGSSTSFHVSAIIDWIINATVSAIVTPPVTPPSGSGGGGGLPQPEFILQIDNDNLTVSRAEQRFVHFNVTNNKSSGTLVPNCEGNACDWIKLVDEIYVESGTAEESVFLILIPVNTTVGSYHTNITGNSVKIPLQLNIRVDEGLDWLFRWLKGEGIYVEYYDIGLRVTDPVGKICSGDLITYEALLISNQMPSQDVEVEVLITDNAYTPMTTSDKQTVFVEENKMKIVTGTIQTIDNWPEGYYRLFGQMSAPDNITVTGWGTVYIDDCQEEFFLLKWMKDFINKMLMKPIMLPLTGGFMMSITGDESGDIEVPFILIIVAIFMVSAIIVWILGKEQWSILAWSLLLTVIASVLLWAVLGG